MPLFFILNSISTEKVHNLVLIEKTLQNRERFDLREVRQMQPIIGQYILGNGMTILPREAKERHVVKPDAQQSNKDC